MEGEKIIRKKEGAISFKTKGDSHFVFNWKDNMVEIWVNGKRVFIIDMNEEN